MRNRFIVLIDFSEYSKNLLQFAADWSARIKAEIVLVHSIPVLLPAMTLTESKKKITALANASFRNQLESLTRRHVVLTGIECHICVYQTALDLMSNGYNVHLVADAVSSRTPQNRDVGVSAIKSAGAQITSTEMVLFELLRTAANPKARDIFKIVK